MNPAPAARRARLPLSASLVAGPALVVGAALPSRALAHGGPVPEGPPTVAWLILGWSFDPLVWLPVVALAALWVRLVGRVDAAHPANRVPRRRTVAFLAGLGVILVALDSGLEAYDTTLFSAHMVQHLLLTLVAPPLLLLAAPVTLALRAASPATRRGILLPALHSRALRVLAHPVVAWLLFAGVMWASHFSPLFDAALEDELVHRLEHGLYLGSALLFWWPAVAADPAPRRMGFPARLLYVGLQMPQNTFLALAIYSATAPLYPHYMSVERSWGPTPLADQQAAGGIMWLGGDLLFLGAVLLLVAAWLRAEERRGTTHDRREAVERAAIREREERLAARRRAEAGGGPGPGSGPGASAVESSGPQSGSGAASSSR